MLRMIPRSPVFGFVGRMAAVTILALAASVNTLHALNARDPVWRLPQEALNEAWSQLPIPSDRYAHSAVLDELRNRIVIFGGGGPDSWLNDTWYVMLDETLRWVEMPTEGPRPSPRHRHTAVYDPVRQRMIVFGGEVGDSGVWALSLGDSPAWTQLVPPGVGPGSRYGCSAVYDPDGDRMIMFGGAWSGIYDDTWALSLSGTPTWTQLSPEGSTPPARWGHSAIYDPIRKQMVIFGGSDGSTRNDVWVLQLGATDAWIPLIGLPAPSPRREHTAVYDAIGDRMVVFYGVTSTPWVYLSDVWAFTLSGEPAWELLSASGQAPSPRFGHTCTFDPLTARIVMLAGADDAPAFRSDIFALSVGGASVWSAAHLSGDQPGPRQEHVAIVDSKRNRMVVYGGIGDGDWEGVWSMALGTAPAWDHLAPTGTWPPGHWNTAAIYDSLRDRMVMFGGYGPGNEQDRTWALSLDGVPAWTEILPAGAIPPPRKGHIAVHDVNRDRMIIFGGSSSTTYRNDTWALGLDGAPTWEQIIPGGTPPSKRSAHSAIYDPVRDRVIVFGGRVFSGAKLNDVWALDLSGTPAWTQLSPGGLAPSPRHKHSAVYDPTTDRMIVFGGEGSSPHSDVWALSLSGAPEWTDVTSGGSAPAPRLEHSAVFDAPRNRMIVFGGRNETIRFGDSWQFQTDPPVSVPAELMSGAGALMCSPNPFSAVMRFSFALTRASDIRLDVFDVSGRRVRALIRTTLSAGGHEVTWNGRDETGRLLAAGVYLARLESANGVSTRRIVRF